MARADAVAAVVLNWTTEATTVACLDALLHSEGAAVFPVVVDNGSPPGCLERLRAVHPGVPVIEAGRNLGFAGGSNLGIEWALRRDFPYLLLINDDAAVAPDCLALLIRAALEHPRAGLLGPAICRDRAMRDVECLGATIDGITGRHRLVRPDPAHLKEPRAVDALTGTCLLVRALVVRRVGLLASAYFAYFEDYDYCRRALFRGFFCLAVPRARVYHRRLAARGGRIGTERFYYGTRNHLLAARRYGVPLPAPLQAAREGHIILCNAAHALVASRGRPLAALGAVARGAVDFSRGRFGEGSPR